MTKRAEMSSGQQWARVCYGVHERPSGGFRVSRTADARWADVKRSASPEAAELDDPLGIEGSDHLVTGPPVPPAVLDLHAVADSEGRGLLLTRARA